MKQRGLSLIELMVAMVLGLLLLAGLVSLFQANRKTFENNQGLFQIQESVRTSFELLSRDMRQTGFTKCGNGNKIANVLNQGTGDNRLLKWFGILGADGGTALLPVEIGTAVGQRVSETSAVLVQGVQGGGRSVAQHDSKGGKFTLNTSTSGTAFTAGEILMVCDSMQASIFQATSTTTDSVTYGTTAGTPGNCLAGLGLPGTCGSTPIYVAYSPNATVERFMSVIWYVGNNGRPNEGGRSLYRARLGVDGVTITEEVVAGVTDLQIQYHLNGDTTWNNAAALSSSDWGSVDALRLTVMLMSMDSHISTNNAVDNGRLKRSFTQTVALRNRLL